MAKQKESKIVAGILKALKERGHHGVKVHGGAFGVTGEPDIHACIYGRAVVIEVKVPGQKPTPHQRYRMGLWEQAGALALWFDSVAGFEAWLESVRVNGVQ